MNKPKWSFAIWDLDKLNDAGNPTVLPIPTAEGDWIRAHEAIGPQAAISQVENLVKPGDRLLGYVLVLCPDCLKDRAYWVYAVAKQGGWFSETVGGYPDLSSLSKTIPTLRNNPESFFRDVPQSARIPIYNTIRDIPKP